MDLNPSSGSFIYASDPDSWIPGCPLGGVVRGVYFQDSFLACDRTAACKRLPIGHHEWIDAPSYQEPVRNYMTMAVVDGLVFLTGGRPLTAGCKRK